MLDYQSPADTSDNIGHRLARGAAGFVAAAAVTASIAVLCRLEAQSRDAWGTPGIWGCLLTWLACFVAFILSVTLLFQSRGRRGWITLALSIVIPWIALWAMVGMIDSLMST